MTDQKKMPPALGLNYRQRALRQRTMRCRCQNVGLCDNVNHLFETSAKKDVGYNRSLKWLPPTARLLGIWRQLMDLEQRNPLGSCRFCSHLTDVERKVSVNSPWHRNAQYGALVSIGALVPGWSLVCPIDHCFNLSSHYKRDEFWEFCAVASDAVAQRYGNVRIFEHGAQFSGSKTGCGTDHAHLHLVPLDFSLAREALRYNSSLNWTPCLARDIEELAQNQEYLFVADDPCGRDTAGLLCLPTQAESQFFRRVIAERIGLRDFYDYKKYPMLDIAESSLVDLVSGLSTAR